MTKSTLALAAALVAAGMASASPLSPREALTRALAEGDAPVAKFSGMKAAAKVTPALTVNTKTGNPALYVINNVGEEGFLVVAADDAAAPLLGWTDSGEFDADNMAPGLRYWLGALQEQIAWAEYNGLPAYSAPAPTYYATIAPLMTTKWDQGAPYNDLCPLDGTRRTYTGCVATAMAQIINAHKYPTKGVGTYSYSWNGQTLSFDYGNTTFEYDKMLDSYNAMSSAESKTAVATLMYACGVSVDMGYGTYSSGAVSAKVPQAMVDCFGFDKGIEFHCRAFYTSQQWEKMIYDEIANNGPVYMSGRNDEGGHAFVADGYNKGFFHMNWGWSGLSDGYYRVNALDPDSQGTGGSSAGYNVDQGILINVKPAVEGSEYAAPYIIANRPISAYMSGSYLYITGPFYNYSARQLSGRLGVQLYDFETGEEGQLVRMSIMKFAPGSGVSAINLSTSLVKKGHWRGKLVYTEGSTVYPIQVPLSQAGYIDFTKAEDGTLSVSVPTNGVFTPGELEFVSPVYTNKMFSVRLNYTSTAEENYTHEVVAYLLDPETLEIKAQGGVQNTIIEPGTGYFDYTSEWLKNPAAGTYKFALAAADSPGTEIDYLSAFYDVTLERGSATFIASIANDAWEIIDPNDVDINNVQFKADVNITYGYMSSPIVARIYNAEGTGNPIGTIASPLVFGTKGDLVSVNFAGPFLDGQPQTTYTVFLYDSRGTRLTSVGKTMTTGAQTGLDAITAADDEEGAEYFTLQGMKVSNPLSGQLYLMRTASGKVKKVIK